MTNSLVQFLMKATEFKLGYCQLENTPVET